MSERHSTVVRLLVTIEDQPDAEGREHSQKVEGFKNASLWVVFKPQVEDA